MVQPVATATLPFRPAGFALQPVETFARLVPGAARFGRRTPEPHDWLAAPLTIIRGDGRRGARMNDDRKLLPAERLEQLREKATTQALPLEEAVLAFGPDDLAEELLRLEATENSVRARHVIYFPTTPAADRARAIDIQLRDSLRDKLLCGELCVSGIPVGEKGRVHLFTETWDDDELELYIDSNEVGRDGKVFYEHIRITTPPASETASMQDVPPGQKQKKRTPRDPKDTDRICRMGEVIESRLATTPSAAIKYLIRQRDDLFPINVKDDSFTRRLRDHFNAEFEIVDGTVRERTQNGE